MARPRKKIDPEIVKKLAAIHCTMIEIAAVCECSVDTLERRFADVIKTSREKGRASLRRLQWEKAQSGNVGMMIWLGKQLLDQREKADEHVTMTGAEGGPVSISHESEEERTKRQARVEALLKKRAILDGR